MTRPTRSTPRKPGCGKSGSNSYPRNQPQQRKGKADAICKRPNQCRDDGDARRHHRHCPRKRWGPGPIERGSVHRAVGCHNDDRVPDRREYPCARTDYGSGAVESLCGGGVVHGHRVGALPVLTPNPLGPEKRVTPSPRHGLASRPRDGRLPRERLPPVPVPLNSTAGRCLPTHPGRADRQGQDLAEVLGTVDADRRGDDGGSMLGR